MLLAIAILAILAFALLLAPTFVWLRRRLSRANETERPTTTEGTLDPKAVSTEIANRAVTLAQDAPEPAPGLDPVTADPNLEDRVVRIVSWTDAS